jgi:hypothetical protein
MKASIFCTKKFVKGKPIRTTSCELCQCAPGSASEAGSVRRRDLRKRADGRPKYDELVDQLLSFIRRSFNSEDLKVLKRVVESDVSVNIQKLNLIIADLNRIKRAMIEAESRKEAQAA